MNNAEQQFPAPIIRVAKQTDSVKIHTFICPERFFATATHVIEGLKESIVIDGQLVVWYAKAFRDYIDRLGKPIGRVYLSHDHPDHFFGLSAAFGDAPMYALPETIRSLAENGEAIRKAQYERFGSGVPESVVIPAYPVTPGEEIVDGIRLRFEHVADAEVKHQLVIKLPDLGVAVLQDLLYSGGHVYIESLDLDNWIDYLKDLIASDYELFLPGHGEPTDKNELMANISYMEHAIRFAKQHASDMAGYKSALLAAFPARIAPQILDIGASRLFGGSAGTH